MTINALQYHVIFRPEPEGGYTVIVPSLPGCITYGKTLPAAQNAARLAMRAYVESLKKHKERIPTPDTASLVGLVPLSDRTLVHA